MDDGRHHRHQYCHDDRHDHCRHHHHRCRPHQHHLKCSAMTYGRRYFNSFYQVLYLFSKLEILQKYLITHENCPVSIERLKTP